jgi:hypothetical protein
MLKNLFGENWRVEPFGGELREELVRLDILKWAVCESPPAVEVEGEDNNPIFFICRGDEDHDHFYATAAEAQVVAHRLNAGTKLDREILAGDVVVTDVRPLPPEPGDPRVDIEVTGVTATQIEAVMSLKVALPYDLTNSWDYITALRKVYQLGRVTPVAWAVLSERWALDTVTPDDRAVVASALAGGEQA